MQGLGDAEDAFFDARSLPLSPLHVERAEHQKKTQMTDHRFTENVEHLVDDMQQVRIQD